MQRIPLSYAAPAMVLAKPVQRDDGMVLLAEGTELTSSLITRLQSMKIEHIVVEGNPVDLDGTLSEFNRSPEDLDRLFRKLTDNDFMMKLKSYLDEYFQVRQAANVSQAEDADGESGELPS